MKPSLFCNDFYCHLGKFGTNTHEHGSNLLWFSFFDQFPLKSRGLIINFQPWGTFTNLHLSKRKNTKTLPRKYLRETLQPTLKFDVNY